jgi:hypothetical protein
MRKRKEGILEAQKHVDPADPGAGWGPDPQHCKGDFKSHPPDQEYNALIKELVDPVEIIWVSAGLSKIV